MNNKRITFLDRGPIPTWMFWVAISNDTSISGIITIVQIEIISMKVYKTALVLWGRGSGEFECDFVPRGTHVL